MATRGRTILHVRIDDTLMERLDTLAAKLGVDRSIAVRSLIAAALADTSTETVTRETMLMLSAQRKMILGKLSQKLIEATTEIVNDLGEAD